MYIDVFIFTFIFMFLFIHLYFYQGCNNKILWVTVFDTENYTFIHWCLYLYLYIAVWELFARDVIIKSCAWQLSTLVEIYTSFPSHPNSTQDSHGNSKIFSFSFLLLFPFLIWFSLHSFCSSSPPGNLSNAQIQSMSDIGQEQRKKLFRGNL